MAEQQSALRQVLTALLILVLAGCASVTHQAQDKTAACRALFKQIDNAVDQQKVRDHGAEPISGFPYLRITRLLASFRDELNTQERFSAWIDHLAALDSQARGYEINNIDTPVAGVDDASLSRQLDDCRKQLIATELVQPEMRERLRVAATVPDVYLTSWRMAGLYPLTAPLVSMRVDHWQNETRKVFATPLSQLPVKGTLTRWAIPQQKPLAASEVSDLLKHRVDPLGLPILAPTEEQRLFDTFAPVWEVDVASDDDRIGAPYWSRRNILAVDTLKPVLYRLLSHTRFNGMVLLQLNYIIWFPARHGDDDNAGQLDGINWRVTLGPDGTPWLIDAIHNSGGYYLDLPSPHLRLRSDLPPADFEIPLQPQTIPEGHPLTVRIAAATHDIQRVYHADKPGGSLPMSWREYDTLRSLPARIGNSSLFGEYGIIEGTTRSERFLLWPTGVRSPGAMRQWGQHAIAYVGRRHFDDAHLLDSLFEQVAQP